MTPLTSVEIGLEREHDALSLVYFSLADVLHDVLGVMLKWIKHPRTVAEGVLEINNSEPTLEPPITTRFELVANEEASSGGAFEL